MTARHARGLRSLLLMILVLPFVACEAESQSGVESVDSAALRSKAFADYWYQGKAEVNSYRMQQARYGELREADAVLIFVTEDFDTDRQVKLESDPTGRNVATVLKTNMTRKFITGVYPYSMMTSVFTPVAHDSLVRPLKITTSSQEWCGHTWTQLNRRGGSYDVTLRSYFDAEGDRSPQVDALLPEDGLWNLIRLTPVSLPTGSFRLLPSTMVTRLRHTPFEASTVTAALADLPADSLYGRLRRYTVEWPNRERVLAIDFEGAFPHRIIGWSDSYRDGFGPRAQMLTSSARLHRSMMLDYWRHNAIADTLLRDSLDLRY